MEFKWFFFSRMMNYSEFSYCCYIFDWLSPSVDLWCEKYAVIQFLHQIDIFPIISSRTHKVFSTNVSHFIKRIRMHFTKRSITGQHNWKYISLKQIIMVRNAFPFRMCVPFGENNNNGVGKEKYKKKYIFVNEEPNRVYEVGGQNWTI